MALPDFVLHTLDVTLPCVQRSGIALSNLGDVIRGILSSLLTSSDINIDESKQYQVLPHPCDGDHNDPISPISLLFSNTVNEICKFDGTHVMKSIICSLLSILSGPLADEIITA